MGHTDTLIEDQEKEITKLRADLKVAKQTVRNIRNVLADVEWVEEVLHPSSCPWCNEGIKIHSSDCRLNKVLNGL